MQVLLKKSVESLGQIGDIVEVKAGYARNYLLAQGLAMAVSTGNLKLVEGEKKRHEVALKKHEDELRQLGERLGSASVTIQAKANEEGHLFGSVGGQHIADALINDGYQVDVKQIQLDEPIKELGVYEIPVQLLEDVSVSCKVWVVGE